MSLGTLNSLQLYNFWSAYWAADKIPQVDPALLKKIGVKAEVISKKASKDITYQDLAESFRLIYELLTKTNDDKAKAAANNLGVQLYKLLLSFLEDDKRKQLLLYYAFWRETLNSFVIEGATYFKPVLDALPNEESIVSKLRDEKLQFLTLIAQKCIQNAKNNEKKFPNEIDTGKNLAIDLLNSIGTLILVVALLSLVIEFAAGGSLVISVGALSLAIEHLIAGMLLTSASCYTASAGIHYVYELPLENEAQIYQNDNSLRIKC